MIGNCRGLICEDTLNSSFLNSEMNPREVLFFIVLDKLLHSVPRVQIFS